MLQKGRTSMFFDPLYFVFMLPGLAFMLWAQSKVKGNYAKYSKIRNEAGVTGAQAARRVLDSQGLQDVAIEAIPGELSDHYDPRKRVLRLSPGVFGQPTIAAIGIAAHEAGHAIQHAKAYVPMQVRSLMWPVAAFGGSTWQFVFMGGVLLGAFQFISPEAARMAILAGIGLFSFAVLFHMVTLPVEFDASRRAKVQIAELGIVPNTEMEGTRKVLNAAAMTYVVGALSSLMLLVYYIWQYVLPRD